VGGTCGTHGRGEESVQDFGGKARMKETTWKTGRRWEDGISMELREIGLGSVDWIRLSQDRDRWRTVVSAVMNFRVLVLRTSVHLMQTFVVSDIL
jgi:hypothetical protein